MTDHAREVKNLLTDARKLAASLGWDAKMKPNAGGVLVRCPAHEDHDPSCGITKGPDGTLRSRCHACGWSADAIGMIALAHGLNTSSSEDFKAALVIGAEIGGDLRLSDEIRCGIRLDLPKRIPVQEPPPEPPREYPVSDEVSAVWESAGSCASDSDTDEYLRGRAIMPDAATELGLARVIAQGDDSLPQWGTYRRISWALSGYRLIVRVWDYAGKCRSVRSWQVEGREGPKRLPPSGKKAAGLVMANSQAVKILRGQAQACRVLICEGEPDWLTWSTRVTADVAVFGIGTGAWTQEHADKIPKDSSVYVLTHLDEAGDKYAANIIKTIGERAQCWRLKGERNTDENDKARKGTLKDVGECCEPVNDKARKSEAEKPRVFSVVEMMQAVHRDLVKNEEPTMWTSGHWKVDMMTGGLRPDSGWVIGGPSNWGKSSWLIGMCDENMRNWKNRTVPLIVSGEDSEELYAQRLLARRARVNAMRLRDKCLKPDEHKRITAVMKLAEPNPHYLDGRGVNFERLIHQILELVAKYGIKIVALDYIQEFRTKQKYESERVMFREIARVFRHSMKQAKCASVVLTQVTNNTPGKAPNKDNIRECKDIGHGAEVIGMGWEPDEDIIVNGEVLFQAKSRLLVLDKTKNGTKGVIGLDWDGVSACFNRVLKPIGYSDKDTEIYENDADTTEAYGQYDEFDDVICG